jgi:6-phosphogluconolactonase
VEILPDAAAASGRTAEWIAQCALQTLDRQERFVMALSGGTEPWQAFRILAEKELPWSRIHVLQVDERIAPAGHPDRNFTHLQESLLARVPLAQGHAMPVDEPDLQLAADRYSALLYELAGSPPALDLVHLGLGQDGHTASLAPGDPVLEVIDAEVALTGEFRGRRRMTLTLPAINRARNIVWLVPGERKAAALARLLAGGSRDPAARVSERHTVLIADRAAAGMQIT